MSTKNRELNRAERARAIQREQAAGERNRRILITVAIVVVLSAVIAAVVVFSGGGSKKPESTAALPPATAQGQSLVMGGNAKAATKVVVYEDFLCPYCRQFETSTRDFLQAAADKGTVQVEYRPFHLLQDDYSTRALSAWAAVLQQGTPKQALTYHDLLYDKQPYEASTEQARRRQARELGEGSRRHQQLGARLGEEGRRPRVRQGRRRCCDQGGRAGDTDGVRQRQAARGLVGLRHGRQPGEDRLRLVTGVIR